MRALTVRQPWAWAIAYGGKDVENRSRNIAGAYRGPVAIHCARQSSADGADWIEAQGLMPPESAVLPEIERGAVVAVVDLVDVHAWADDSACSGVAGPDGEATCSPWGMPNHHHLILANPRQLPNPIPAKGRLGLWTLPADVEAAVLAQIGDPS